MSDEKRASFGGKLSVILVAAGSAIGLGAIWRFPYIAGKHGGAAFLLVFLLSVFAVGIPVMLAEFAVGRSSRKNAVGAYRSLAKRWSWLGYIGVLGSLLISGYYYVIAGWSLEYIVSSATNSPSCFVFAKVLQSTNCELTSNSLDSAPTIRDKYFSGHPINSMFSEEYVVL